MNESSANLETSQQTQQPNSQADKGTPNKGEPNKQDVQQPQKPRTLADIFGDTEDESSTEIALEEKTPDDPDAPLDSIDRLMKRHKLTPEQAYAIKVPMPNGAEALTIGELKDKITGLTDFEMEQAEFNERRITEEGKLLKAQSELKELMGILPKDAIKPEVLQKLRERQENVVRHEKQLTLQHIPQWRDEKTRNADISSMVATLEDYGFDAGFLNSLVDHRAVKLVRDFALMRNRIKKSLESVRDPKNTGKRPSGKGRPAVRPNANGAARKPFMPTQQDKLAELFSSKE